MTAKAPNVKEGHPSPPEIYSPSKRAKWKQSQAYRDDGWSIKPPLRLLDRLRTPTPPLINRIQGPTDPLNYKDDDDHSPTNFQEEAGIFLSQLSLKERIHGKLINRISSPVEHDSVNATEFGSSSRPFARKQRPKAEDLMDMDDDDEEDKTEEALVVTVPHSPATKFTSDIDALKTMHVDRAAVSEETRPKDIVLDRCSSPGLGELHHSSHHSPEEPSGRDQDILDDDLVEILLHEEPEDDTSLVQHQDTDEDTSHRSPATLNSSPLVAVPRHTTNPASAPSTLLRTSPIEVPSTTIPPNESSSRFTPAADQESIERCRQILVPVIYKNLESRISKQTVDPPPDKELIVRRICEMLTDDRCIQFMLLSSQVKSQLSQGMDEKSISNLINKIHPGLKRPRDETEEEYEARKRRILFPDPVASPYIMPDTNRDAADESVQGQSTKINQSMSAEASNSGLSSSNAQDPHIRDKNNGDSIPPHSDSSVSSAFVVAPRTPVQDHDIEEGELSPEIEYGIDSGQDFLDPFAEQDIDYNDNETPEEGEDLSEKRRGKRKATEEEYQEFILSSQDSSFDDRQQVGSEEGEVADDRLEHEKRDHAPSESLWRSSEPDLSLRPGPVPGLWFVRHGEEFSDILETTFFVNAEVEEGIQRWCRRHKSSGPHRQISLNIQCLPKTDVLEVGERLKEDNSSEEEVARAIWGIPCRWPSKGSLLIQVNHDHVSGIGKTWFSHEMIQEKPIDVSSSVCSGLNSVRIVQLGDMSECIFVLHASEHLSDDSRNSLNWSRYEEMLRTGKVASRV